MAPKKIGTGEIDPVRAKALVNAWADNQPPADMKMGGLGCYIGVFVVTQEMLDAGKEHDEIFECCVEGKREFMCGSTKGGRTLAPGDVCLVLMRRQKVEGENFELVFFSITHVLCHGVKNAAYLLQVSTGHVEGVPGMKDLRKKEIDALRVLVSKDQGSKKVKDAKDARLDVLLPKRSGATVKNVPESPLLAGSLEYYRLYGPEEPTPIPEVEAVPEMRSLDFVAVYEHHYRMWAAANAKGGQNRTTTSVTAEKTGPKGKKRKLEGIAEVLEAEAGPSSARET